MTEYYKLEIIARIMRNSCLGVNAVKDPQFHFRPIGSFYFSSEKPIDENNIHRRHNRGGLTYRLNKIDEQTFNAEIIRCGAETCIPLRLGEEPEDLFF